MKLIKKFKVTAIAFSVMLISFSVIFLIIGKFTEDVGLLTKLISSIILSLIVSLLLSIPVFICEFIDKFILPKRRKTNADTNTTVVQPIVTNNQYTATYNYSNKQDSKEYPKYNSFVAIDFETATKHYNSACSVGIVKVEKNKVVAEEYYLIQPPQNKYLKENTDIHNITPEMTKDAEAFPAVWRKIQHYFENSYLAAHNANFDMTVLKSTLDYYKLNIPDFWYFDSIPVSSIFCKGSGIGRNLNERCAYFGIELNHHNALSDAKACADLILYAINRREDKDIYPLVSKNGYLKSFKNVEVKTSYNFGNKTNKTYARDAVKEFDNSQIEFDDDFKDKTFVFTGQMENLTREQAYEKVLCCGGIVKDAVSKKVDYLVNCGDVETTKLRKALELQDNGHHIKIITEEDFMHMLKDCNSIGL